MKLELGCGGFLGALTLLLVAAKLWGKTSISWIWVLSPLWLGLIIGLLVAFSIIFVFVLAGCTKIVIEEYKKKKIK